MPDRRTRGNEGVFVRDLKYLKYFEDLLQQANKTGKSASPIPVKMFRNRC